MRVLVCDDDPTVREELSDLLRSWGHEVEVAGDGLEASRKIEASPYDVVLLDLNMPGLSGLDVLRRCRVARPEAVAIMITGQGTIDAAVEAMKSGAGDFIEKPFEVEALRRILQGVDDERKVRDLLPSSAASLQAVRDVLEEASRRGALLAVLGGGPAPPLAGAKVLRVDPSARGDDAFPPAQLYRLNQAIEAAIARTERPVVYLGAVDAIRAAHGPGDAKAWVRQLRDRCAARSGTLVLAPGAAALAMEIESEGGAREADPGIQGMLESLASPIRRAIVGYVHGSGPVAYSAILRRNFVDSSSKLSFHLQKLVGDGLLAKGGRGYECTPDGRRAWGVVRAVAEDRKRPSLLVGPDDPGPAGSVVK